eukprot:3268077-Heterocapsa_arctica.AAC.1
MALTSGLEDKVRDWLIAPDGLNARTLDDFLRSSATQEEVAALATQAVPDNNILTTNRLRQAWLALKQ